MNTNPAFMEFTCCCGEMDLINKDSSNMCQMVIALRKMQDRDQKPGSGGGRVVAI